MKESSGIPGMISIYFSYIDAEFVLIGMEYCSNRSLEMYVNNGKEMKNSEEKIKSFSKQILLTMCNLMDNGIVHGDIKPENILMDKFGRLKLSEFKLARETNGQSKLPIKQISGARRYLSLELEDGEPISEKSDVWALGVVILELAYGRGTFKDSDIIRMKSKKIKKEFESRGGYSNEMAEFLAKCFERESVDRATVKDLIHNKWLNSVNINSDDQPNSTIKSGNNYYKYIIKTCELF